ncbi:MAG: hypothetical protein RIA71_12730 [Oceanicaulis sp.]
MKRIVSLGRTAGAVAGSGFALVADTVREARLGTCAKCDYSVRRGGRLSCARCGCDMAVKARFRAAQCPMDKWPD